MLVIAGKNDPRVPVKQADTMVAAIKPNGTPVWYLRAENEGHDMLLKDNVSHHLLTTIAFIKTYLLKQPRNNACSFSVWNCPWADGP